MSVEVEAASVASEPPGHAVARIALQLPAQPTSGDILLALTRAEQAGYVRGAEAMRPRVEELSAKLSNANARFEAMRNCADIYREARR